MTRDENDRRAISGCQFPLEFQATRVRQLQVQDQASGRIRFFGFQEFRGRPKCGYPKSHGGQEAGQRFAYTIVVIHYKHDGIVGVHCGPLNWRGIVKQTVARALRWMRRPGGREVNR